MTQGLKKTISTLLVLVIALVTGFAVGKIYVDNLEVPTLVDASEESLRESDDVMTQLVKRVQNGAKPSDGFSAVELYEIAEYNLNNSAEFYKIMTGTVNAPMGIKQAMKGERLKKDGKLIYNKLSPSTSSLAPSICSRIIYNYSDTDNITIYPKGSFASTSPEIYGDFSNATKRFLTMDEYKETFNTAPTTVMPYIISSKTCAQNKVSPVTKKTDAQSGDATYTFSISIDGEYLSLAGLYYAYEIKFSSGMADPPKWVSMTMDVTIDENFNFVEISYLEVYKMNVSGIGMMQVTDEFVDKFYFTDFEDLPSVQKLLGEVA